MLQSNGASGDENPYFKWGAKKAVGLNKSTQFYESFTYEGTEFQLFDCAYFFVDGECETSIGKLVKMYETSDGQKKVKVVWFFRPIEIRRFLKEYEPQWDELFLACGDEKGVSNINNVEAIMGKCNVLCLSRDPRNRPPTNHELRTTNYVFSRTFDTGDKTISENFADAIYGIRVENFFNKIRVKEPLKRLNSSAAASARASPMKSLRSESGSTKLEKKDDRDGRLTSRTSLVKTGSFLKDRADHAHVHVKKNSSVNSDSTSIGPKTKTKPLGHLLASGSSVDPMPSKRRKLILNTPETDDSPPEPEDKGFVRNIPPCVETAPSQNVDKRSWYKKLPFEEELRGAIEKSRVILIENLEPSYTSLEVEDICKQAFKERVDAKMIPASLLSSPHSGRALVIFQTTKAADNAMSLLYERCLMLPNQRPLVGSREVPPEVEKCRSFTGHFSLVDKALMTIHKRNAVSTSHCAQPNHIVFPMGMQWFALRAKLESRWKKLFEEQVKEINIFKSKETIKEEDASPCY